MAGPFVGERLVVVAKFHQVPPGPAIEVARVAVARIARSGTEHHDDEAFAIALGRGNKAAAGGVGGAGFDAVVAFGF